MYDMFRDCQSLKALDLSSFNTENVTEMNNLFMGCLSLESLNISSFNTKNVTDMSFLLSDCRSLTSLDVSSFNTSKVINMCYMFVNCVNLKSLDLSSYDMGNVSNMYPFIMFCDSLSLIKTPYVTSPYSATIDMELPKREGYSWKVDGTGDTYEYFNRVPANTTIILVKDISNVDVNEIVSDKFQIAVSDNTIFCNVNFRIVNTVGKDVTSQNGYLTAGIYIVKTQYGSKKIVVK